MRFLFCFERRVIKFGNLVKLIQNQPKLTMSSEAAVNNRNTCIFCIIADRNDPKTEILYENETLVVFNDIHPASKHHYLVVPKAHIPDAKSLKKSDLELVQKLVDAAKEVIQSRGGSIEDSRFGFHWPPFNSIRHLHLHAMSPVSEMRWTGKLIFKPKSLWFVTADYVKERLEKMP